jgi:glycosyltransferase involved in cell wall biosynthesis
MRIAQIAPLYEAVPPKKYGGTERIVSYLTEELVAMGHDVTLFASGDSVTTARLESVCKCALRLDPFFHDKIAPHIMQEQRVIELQEQFDVMHFHTDYLYFPYQANCSIPNASTLHGRLDFSFLHPLYDTFHRVPLLGISHSQISFLPNANWRGVVYHGLPEDLYKFRSRSRGDYLAFLGRISPEKRADRAVEIALKAKIRLKIAAKIDPADEDYFKTIAHLFDNPLIEFVGEVTENVKDEFLGNARALLFPIDWPEPFGLVMIEALACGTPVIAYDHGSVREIIEPGESGFIVHSIEQAVAAVEAISQLNRQRCRDIFDTRFTAKRMTRDYLEHYGQLMAAAQPLDEEPELGVVDW